MQAVGDRLRAANVQEILLVHGTFVGDDLLGLSNTLGHVFPKAAKQLREVAKRLVDALANDTGNYTQAYADTFEDALHREGTQRISVHRFHWSGQNNHIGRADAAVRLFATLNQTASLQSQTANESTQKQPTRILLWGHSHAGNVFALLTNMLAADEATHEKFFTAALPYYKLPLLGRIDKPVWEQTISQLYQKQRAIDNVALDMVTFGTPIRYGWETAGYSNLLHFINHRPTSKLPEHLAPFPPRWDDVIAAADGDYIQQLAIAGTNFAPGLLEWRSQLADSALNAFLQPGLKVSGLLERLRVGARVPDEGTTLLIDYNGGAMQATDKPNLRNISKHLLGHAVYTRKEQMLFHAEEIVQQFY